MNVQKYALLCVIFVDIMGQGLIYPIIDTVIMDPEQHFLPRSTPQSGRDFDYGVVMGVFYVCWFFGAAYISNVSDMIGRKKSMLLCLFGAFLGYVLTIVALHLNELWVLIVARAVTGFTAGNQPIAQAALVDCSVDDADRTRNMGHVMVAVSAGLVAGPMIGGVLSDPSMVGTVASLELPFYAAAAMIAGVMLLIATAVEDRRRPLQPFRFEPAEIFLLLWRVAQRPVVLRISLVFFCFELALNTFYIFMDDYLTSRFDYDTFSTSLAIMDFGACLALSGMSLVGYFDQRMTKRAIVVGTQAVIGLCCVAFVFVPAGTAIFLVIAVLGVAFGLGYPTLLAIYSASAGADEQGWIMGVSIALFTLGSGLTSLIGGDAMGIEVRLPFYYAAATAAVTLALIASLWNGPSMRAIVAATPLASQRQRRDRHDR